METSKPDLTTKLLRYGYWSWAADEPAVHVCEKEHDACAVEKDGVCMDWLSKQVDQDYPVKQSTEPLTPENLS